MLPTLQLGPLAVPIPAILNLLGLWLGLSLAERFAPRFGIKTSHLYNLVFIVLIAGLVGARLSYALRYPEAFRSNLGSLLSPNTGLLDVWGAVLVGGIAGLIYIHVKKLPVWSVMDALTPFLAVMAMAMGLAHLASGAAFGAVTNLPWAIDLWGASRHPSQIYETLAALLLLAYFFPGRARWQSEPPGVYFCSFIAAAAGTKILLEAFRGDSVLVSALGIRLVQVQAWIVLAACLYGIYRLRVKPTALKKADDL
jgi:prolipoprotein diacylglyceryltransferase